MTAIGRVYGLVVCNKGTVVYVASSANCDAKETSVLRRVFSESRVTRTIEKLE